MASYEIIIRNETEEEKNEATENLAGQDKDKDKATSKTTTTLKRALKYVALSSTRELVVSKIGAVTRNNLLQRKIDIATSMAQTAYAFAVNPVIGAVTLATSIISQTIDYNLALEKQRNVAQVMWQRAGWINRSRD